MKTKDLYYQTQYNEIVEIVNPYFMDSDAYIAHNTKELNSNFDYITHKRFLVPVKDLCLVEKALYGIE